MNDSQLQTLSAQIGEALKQRNATVTCAESCTGGWIAKVFTDISGSSAWFERGFVTYSNEAKQELVGVSAASLAQSGAVSEAVVREMAVGARQQARADYAISVSGIAGPEGAVKTNPWERCGLALPAPTILSWLFASSLTVTVMRCAVSRLPGRCRHWPVNF